MAFYHMRVVINTPVSRRWREREGGRKEEKLRVCDAASRLSCVVLYYQGS